MRNSLVKKGLAFGMIILFFGAGVIPCVGLTFIKDFQNIDFIEEEFLFIKEDDEVFKNRNNQRITKPEFILNKSKIILSNKEPQRGLSSNRETTLYVGGSGPNNYTKIQSAINDASDGHTIFVFDDSSPYYENIIINKSINLIGEDKDTTIITGWTGISLNGLAYDPTSHKLYGASSYSLYEVDIDSGHQTYIGDFNTGGYGIMIAISFDNIGNCYGVDIGYDSLYSVDTDTGEATLIGSFSINLNYAQDCAYDRDNEIFYLSAFNVDSDDRDVVDDRAPEEKRSWGGELYICTTDTANLTLVGPFENGAEITGFAIPYNKGIEFDRRFGLRWFPNKLNFRGSRYEPFYGYCAYDPGGQMTDYIIFFNSDTPGNLTTIAYTQSDDFITGADWVNDTWYGVEYGTGRLYTIDPNTGDMNPIGYDGDVVSIFADWVNISGFKIINGLDGILVYSNNNTIKGNNIISNNNDGIHLYNSSNNTITGNSILNNGCYWDSEGSGIYLSSSNNNIITGNIVSNNGHGDYGGDGIHLRYSSNNFVINNNVSLSGIDGISLYYSSTNNTIVGNNISRSIEWDGIYLDNSDYNSVAGNTITETVVGIRIFLATNNNIKNNTASNNWCGVRLYGFCGYNNVIGNNLANNSHGITIDHCGNHGNFITENIISNNKYWGISLDYSDDNIIISNTISGNEYGIYLEDSNSNTINGNNISNNGYGIYLSVTYYSSEDNIITDNNIILNNNDGIKLEDSNRNTITKNTISNNRANGLILYCSGSNTIKSNNISNNINGFYIYSYSYKNVIYQNNFINNKQNAYDICYNIWDIGKKGNYWSDYKEKYPDAKKQPFKGIWDTPYEIEGGDNKDNCPLINQWPKSKSRTILRNSASYSSFLSWLFELFTSLERLLSLFRVI